MDTKLCVRCNTVKSTSNFTRDKSRYDGLYPYCKDCKYSIAQLQRDNPKWKQHKHKYDVERWAKYKAAQPAKPPRVLLFDRKDPDCLKRYYRQYYKTHKAEYRITVIRRYARKRNLPDAYLLSDWEYALDYFHHCCAVCGRPRGFWHTIARDHWIPLNSPLCPGTIPTNIVPLCQGLDGCNNSKADTPASEWLTKRFGKRKAITIQKRVELFFHSITKRPQ